MTSVAPSTLPTAIAMAAMRTAAMACVALPSQAATAPSAEWAQAPTEASGNEATKANQLLRAVRVTEAAIMVYGWLTIEGAF